ncbi:hypothetical protein FACS1894111_02260 [Clostridia bacterium]|nr:hypothetical protein FACS1894111_02260 [Clostridia bacterium]
MKEKIPIQTRTTGQNMIFNTAGSLVYFAALWLLSVLIVRISGFFDAGLLSLAMSATAAPAVVSLFNIRSFQVSDLVGEYQDQEYIRSRHYTNALSFLVCVLIVLVYGYSGHKALIILAFMVFKAIEGLADVYYGIEQKRERMDYAGLSLAIRGVGGLLTFCVTFFLTKSLLFSILAMAVFSLAVILLYDKGKIKRWHLQDMDLHEINAKEPKSNKKMFSSLRTHVLFLQGSGRKAQNKKVFSLLHTCLPLMIVAFLNNLSITLPRIFLEQYHGEKVMGIFSSVSSPTLVINMAAITLFAPLIPALTAEYNKGNKKAFLHGLRKFTLLITLMTVIAMIAAWFLATPALTLLFGKEIKPYVYLFLPIVLISVLMAVNGALFSICTLTRAIKSQYVIGAWGIVAAFLTSLTLVKAYSMNGVTLAMVITVLIQIAIQLVIVGRKIRAI